MAEGGGPLITTSHGMADLVNYGNADRDIDQICKDKVEAEVWIAGAKALISPGKSGRSKIDGRNEGGVYFDDNGDLTSSSASDSPASATRHNSLSNASVSFATGSSPRCYWRDKTPYSERSHVALHNTNMQVKGSNSDAFRVSVSSAPSTSSHGSGPDDCDALGDVYIWGEVISDNYVKVGVDKNSNFLSTRTDLILPKPLECNVVLDVHHIACGVRHAALVTRQGEVFTWGEESGGRLGHGVGKDAIHPCFVESLAGSNVDMVACGEFHTCAVTMAGELYTWGDGTHHAGLLGNGTDVSHWIPKRISGTLEGLQVASVTCGPWHTALVTTTGQLFTFGDGTFGVLGHGNRESLFYPREVESLSGLRTLSVACGVWHTAAVVEVMVTSSSACVSSGKLFTWGDGDKNRLGHGDKEARLEPACVSPLIDYNFLKAACGHCLTIALTTSGQIFTMGSSVYGQLGNSHSDGKQPCLVEDKLIGEPVEEIACGAYHVAVITSRNEVYTWGKGANGRLGHGDTEDRKTPSLVEALKDRHVKYIACGSNYTAAICLHKWVSGVEQSQCSACRQTFGFTRKRHNCYNCGFVHCHSCSSKKAMRAALAPNPSKPHRVCDSCYAKLNNVVEASATNKRNSANRLSGENKDRLDRADLRLSKTVMPSNVDLIKQLDSKAAKQGKKAEAFFMLHPSPAPLPLQLKDASFSSPVDPWKSVPKSAGVTSRPVSPFSRRPSPPLSPTPGWASGFSFSASITDSLKKTNDLLSQEVQNLRAEIESLRHRCNHQESELQKSAIKAQNALALAAEESNRSKCAKEVIKSLTAQLRDMGERLPAGVYDSNNLRPLHLPNGLEPNGNHFPDAYGVRHSRSDSSSTISDATPRYSLRDQHGANEPHPFQHRGNFIPNGRDDPDARMSNASGGQTSRSSLSETVDGSSGPLQDGENGMKTGNSRLASNGNQVEAEWIDQYEPGVYITLTALRDGTRELKRVRFSRRKFGENQAEAWWSENREKVNARYNVRGLEKSSVTDPDNLLGQASHRSDGLISSSFKQP